MRATRSFLIVLGVLAFCAGFPSLGRADVDVEALIDQLPNTSEMSYGYSALFSGSQFLPYPDSDDMGMLVLGSEKPKKSDALEAIVRSGFSAVGLLLKHLDDARATKIPPVEGMMWVKSPDEYDFNSRTRVDPPKGVNRQDVGAKSKENTHTITVGDLCFVALGQIVNRNFNATRYQATGGLIINSPTSSKVLCDVVRADFKDFTPEKHRQLLLQDFASPDYEDRRTGAYLRLSFYYPKDVEEPVLKQLKVPTYDGLKVEPFVRDELYSEKTVEQRKKKFDDFVKTNGPAYSDGVLVELFEDLNIQEADEEHRLSPPLAKKYDARDALIQLYGYKAEVKSQDKPYIKTWEGADEASFIAALVHTRSDKIDAAVYEVFLHAEEDDYLACACIRDLAGKGHDQEFEDYCRQRISKGSEWSKDFNELLGLLEAKAKKAGK